MSDDIDAIFRARPIRPEEEKSEVFWAGHRGPKVAVIEREVRRNEVQLTEDAMLRLSGDTLIIRDGDARVLMPAELAMRIAEFIQGGME